MTLLAVVGAHLSGQPLNKQLTSRGATLVATTTTAPVYRLYALPTEPPKPGLVRVGDVAGAGAVVSGPYLAMSSNIAPQLPCRYDAAGGIEKTRESRSATKAADSEPGSGWNTPTPEAAAPNSAASSPTSFVAQSRKD